jgi:hypothetical protein
MAGSSIRSRTFRLYRIDSALWRQKDQTRSYSVKWSGGLARIRSSLRARVFWNGDFLILLPQITSRLATFTLRPAARSSWHASCAPLSSTHRGDRPQAWFSTEKGLYG